MIWEGKERHGCAGGGRGGEVEEKGGVGTGEGGVSNNVED